jgi:hypothetical protein
VIDAQSVDHLLEAPPVARHQTLDQNRGRTESLRLGGRPPLPPQPVPVIEKQPLDDDGDVGRQAAALFEAAQYFVVAVDEMQPHFRPEIVSLGCAQAMAAAHLSRDVIDDGETREKEGFTFQ